MLFQTTKAHEELRSRIRSFAEEEIKPIAFMLDQQNEFPTEAIRKLGELGWMGIPFPTEYGGAGLDALSYAIAVEELARVDGGAGVILSAHVSLGSWPIFAYGTEAQKQKYLIPLAKGEKIGAFGLTEPNAGSDAGGTETTAVDKGDHWLLNGGKIFITNAPKADTYVIFAVTEISLDPYNHYYLPFWVYKNFDSERAFNTYINRLKEYSHFQTSVDVQPGDRLLTMATCTGINDSERLLVVARKVRDGEDTIELKRGILSTTVK